MKIELNHQLDTGQLLDLENHLLEKFEEAYLTERPDLDQLAIRGSVEIQNEELGNELISFIELNVPRVIIWKDGTKVADKFGASNPFDLGVTTPAKVVEQLLAEGLSVTAGSAPNSVIIRATEPRGVQASALKSMGFNIAYGDEPNVTAQTAAGRTLAKGTLNYNSFKPTSLVLTFPEGTNALEQGQALADKYFDKAQGEAGQREQNRVEAPARRAAAAKSYRKEYSADREKLYQQFGKTNVQSVTARQIGGDDGYQWTVLINGRPFVNGLTQPEVDGYKRQAYAELVKRNGVR
jgi:hypothetical protein